MKKQIEKNELYYFELVNSKEDQKETIVFSNSYVPQMYDHNFWYIKIPEVTSELKKQVFEAGSNREFFKLFGKIIALEEKFEWNDCSLPNHISSNEELVYMKLETTDQLKKAVSEASFKLVRSQEELAEYCAFSYQGDLQISASFAEEKNNFQRQLYKMPEVRFLSAFYDGKMVGHLEIYELIDYYKLENVYVEENFRKRGIASGMLKAAVESLPTKEKGVFLTAEKDGEAVPLYQKLGFTIQAQSSNRLYLKK